MAIIKKIEGDFTRLVRARPNKPQKRGNYLLEVVFSKVRKNRTFGITPPWPPN